MPASGAPTPICAIHGYRRAASVRRVDWSARMYRILSTTPIESVDRHVDVTYPDRTGWSENMGATILPIMVGDDHSGPFMVLSYVAPSEEQMPLSFAHAHPS